MLKQWINLSHSGIDFQRVFRYRLERKEVPYERGRKELLDMMVGERVDMLLTLMKRAEKKGSLTTADQPSRNYHGETAQRRVDYFRRLHQ